MSTSSGQSSDRAGAGACAICGEGPVTRSMEDQEFAYREGNREVMLHARVPVLRCAACGEDYADAGAEQAQHAALCSYLGRLTPEEIRALRERHHMSQAQLAAATKIGIASIKRWESGSKIQNASLDSRLRALDGDAAAAPRRDQFRFRTTLSDEVREAARQFKLRPQIGAYAEAA